MRGVILVAALLIALFFVIGVPIIGWAALVPVLFWQKLAMIAVILVYESFACPIGFMVLTGLASVLYGD